jgi:multidrug efflux system outer membrane protein
MDLRGAQRQILIAEGNAKSQNETLDLTRAKVRAGLANDLDVARQEAQVASTLAQIPSLQTRAAADIHALALLTAQTPSALDQTLGTPTPLPAPPPSVPVGLPSDLLRRRPDIRRAERNLAAATARIGVATADLYPKFSLTGALGWEANHFQNWTNSSSTFWNVVPGVTVPLFNAGRLRANVAVERARTDQFLATYQKTVLNSLAEVEDALVAYQKEFVRRQQLANAVAANQRSVALSTQLYQQGLRDFLNVLDAQRELYASQDALALSDTQVSANAVALFKALGGGWEIDQQQVASTAK